MTGERVVQHTPGPWETFDYGDHGTFVITRDSSHRRFSVARVYTAAGDQYGPNNANLIAAAPELLDFARSTLSWLDAVEQDDLTEEARCLYGEGQLVIAKAEGRA